MSRFRKHLRSVLIGLASVMLFIQGAPAAELDAESARNNLFLAHPSEPLYWTKSNCCGLVAAFMTAHSLGKPVQIVEVVDDLPVTPFGTSMFDLVQFFEKRGFQVVGVEMPAATLHETLRRRSDLRAIALMNNAHWISIVGATADGVKAYDYPNWALIPLEELKTSFAEKVILVEAPHRDYTAALLLLLPVSVSVVLSAKLFCRILRVF